MATKTKSKKASKSLVKSTGSLYDKWQKDIKAGMGRGEFWKPEEGRHMVRPLSFTDSSGEQQLFVKDSKHWLDREHNVPCIRDTEESCPLCELEEEIPGPTWGKIKAQTKYLCNLLVVDDEGKARLVIGQLAKTVAEQLLDCGKQLGDHAFDPIKGHNFRITRTGTGLNTKYTVIPVEKPSKIDGKFTVIDLLDRRKSASYEEVEAAADTVRNKGKR